MQFKKDYLYHIYNQGNNKQNIFFKRENYIFFLRKIKAYILPYADILAWCLMPNHFHLMVLVNEVEFEDAKIGSATPSRAPNTNLNKSIGILLASYTRAINKEQNRSGSLFRDKTKAECINCPNGITPSFTTKDSITKIKIISPEKQYPKICFDYIHQNPVKADLVKKAVDWEFSSALDYYGNRKGSMVNKKVAKEYINIF